MSNCETNIFGDETHQNGVGFHNVGELLVGAHPDTIRRVNGHYGKRCGHFPPAENIFMVAPDDPETISQLNYLQSITHQNIQNTTIGSIPPDSLVVPYINMPQTEDELRAKNINVWGLPAVLTLALKNKAECHRLIAEAQVPDFETPEFTICTFAQIPAEGCRIFADNERLYAQTNLPKYPNGVMVRAAMSDGNYGGCWVRQDPDNKFTIAPEGHPSETRYSDPHQALSAVQQYMRKGMNEQVNNQVVMSRLIDLADSPGMSLIFVNGIAHSLGWNGQVKQGSACVGTSSYITPSPELKRVHQENEDRTAQAFETFITQMCLRHNIDPRTLNCAVNVDWMIPSPAESELQRRLGKTPQITVAEINPRFTNWTDALMLVLWAESLPKTIESLHGVIRQGVLTADKYPVPIPPQMSVSQLRDEVYELDRRLSGDGTRVLLRMPDTPHAGIVFAGDINQAQTELNNILYPNP